MDYKLLVLDVDGTLLNSQHELTKRTHDTLIKAQQMGVRIVLASGRPPYGLQNIVDELDLKSYGGYYIAYNGSQIYEAATGNLIFERRVNPELLPYLEKKARQYHFPIFTYEDNRLITDTPDDPHVRQEAALNGMEIVYEPEFSICVDFAPCKVVLVNDDEEAINDLYGRWKLRLGGTVEVHRSEKFFLEILPSGIDKSGALSLLIDQLKVNPMQVVAFGDGIRDIGMLQIAGHGIAMGNAEESVRACADQITDTNDNDGVAKALEKAFETLYKSPEKIPLNEINRQLKTSMIGHLGISLTYVSDSRVEATMPVDHRTRQPFGILHGGATLALAETVAGLGSMLSIKPEEYAVGMQVSGNHISSAHEGDTVRAVATIVHRGRSSHVWNVDVFTSTNKLVSTVRVVNSILKK